MDWLLSAAQPVMVWIAAMVRGVAFEVSEAPPMVLVRQGECTFAVRTTFCKTLVHLRKRLANIQNFRYFALSLCILICLVVRFMLRGATGFPVQFNPAAIQFNPSSI